ncbi:M42 family metallopeptidase [Clostridium tagluense]|uniref:M42 family metallopeptidase n=1 Tax=Clostridium tagluense TaxID=360422 RepID=UPI001C6E22F8|nr:M42 family metallopeptidase [Clostridium tagluense]MBW9158841.1 M42 family metallopeptidase [Clostridium tagluense]WLC65804.1 M42 family metallopeptidase [Clostridium tagluense]
MDIMLQKLVGAFGVSGHEDEVRAVIREELKDINCDIKEDKMGNLIVKVGSGAQKIMFSAHMDEIGLIATYIEDNGFVRVSNIGGIHASEIVHNFVVFKNGIMGKVGAAKSEPKIEDLFIDLGVSSREEALKKIKEGDTACLLSDFMEVEDKIISPCLDDRIGCYVLLRMIKEIKETKSELYFVFSTQEELGGRGARAAAYTVNPDYCIVLDTQEAGDYIGAEGKLELGKGPIIKIKDRTLIMHHEIKEMLENAAQRSVVKVQYGVSNGSTDGGNIHKENGGIRTGVISIPCRYTHSISEMISMEDVEDTIKLLKGFSI